MKVVVYSSKPYDKEFFTRLNFAHNHQLTFLEAKLTEQTVALAQGAEAVCLFVNDIANGGVLEALSKGGVKLVLMRCAGFNNVDLDRAKDLGITVLRVPAYSPHAVAEHACALLLALTRHVHKAYNRVREGNFALEGLMGFDLNGKTVGVVGTGKIGVLFAKIMLNGFGCKVVAFDVYQSDEVKKMGIKYVSLDELYGQADIISFHVPLLPSTKHMINSESIAKMKKGVTIINTSRGGLVDSKAIIEGLKSKKIGALGLDVYEEEGDLFFEDLSNQVLQDDNLARLLTFNNVLITGHQAFFTSNAMEQIAQTTLTNASDFAEGKVKSENEVKSESHKKPAAEQKPEQKTVEKKSSL